MGQSGKDPLACERNDETFKDTRSGPGYSPLLLVVLLAVFAAAYFPVWRSLVAAWSESEEYSHGFLILPICIYVIWRKKETLRSICSRPSLWGLGLVLLSLAAYVFARLAGILTAASLSMVLLAVGAIVFLYGSAVLRELIFPLFMLFFMIPIPAQLYAYVTIPLQLFVSKASVWAAALLGVPIYREGNVIFLPEHTLQVVQACSGMRSMISLLALSAVFGYFALKSILTRSVLFFSAIPISIFINIVRLILMVLAYYYVGWNLAEGAVHTLFGVLLFALSLVLLAAARGVLSVWEGDETAG